ncbi:hypothetical protein [Novosphingobium nitrogenifigens]|uniref:hypothetical protein n=1 Tax=Novosphingobium nitrogenifigens TaxID=378548 RepID=UPI0003620D1E|nr:hypothetical protein [Novosphingobium nitrogenifigens]
MKLAFIMQGSSKTGLKSNSICEFDLMCLKPGDVVLERGHRAVIRAIRLFDVGRYSHALILLDGRDFIESVGMSVLTCPRHVAIPYNKHLEQTRLYL